MSYVLSNLELRSWHSVLVLPLNSTIREFRKNRKATVKKNENLEIELSQNKIGKDAKTIYVNDAFNLDTIPFNDVKNIIDEISNDWVMNRLSKPKLNVESNGANKMVLLDLNANWVEYTNILICWWIGSFEQNKLPIIQL